MNYSTGAVDGATVSTMLSRGLYLKGATMKKTLSPSAHAGLLQKLRCAVVHQIELWEISTSIAEELDCELKYVLDWVQANSITADTGLEVGQQNSDDFLGLRPIHIERGGPLNPRTIQ